MTSLMAVTVIRRIFKEVIRKLPPDARDDVIDIFFSEDILIVIHVIAMKRDKVWALLLRMLLKHNSEVGKGSVLSDELFSIRDEAHVHRILAVILGPVSGPLLRIPMPGFHAKCDV